MKNILIVSIFSSLLFLVLVEKKTMAAKPSCQDTVNSVMKDIKNKGTNVTFSIDNSYDYATYLNEILDNDRRINGINLDIGGSGRADSIAQNILYSEVLMTSYAQRIFAHCGGTGTVEIGMQNTDWIVSFAMRDDGVFGSKDCFESRSEITAPISRVHMDWGNLYCAYVQF